MMKLYFKKTFPLNDLIMGTQKSNTYTYRYDVLRFFGRALRSCRKLQLHTLERTQKRGKTYLINSKIKLLDNMMTTEAKMRNDDDYMSRCYASVNALYNKGISH